MDLVWLTCTSVINVIVRERKKEMRWFLRFFFQINISLFFSLSFLCCCFFLFFLLMSLFLWFLNNRPDSENKTKNKTEKNSIFTMALERVFLSTPSKVAATASTSIFSTSA